MKNRNTVWVPEDCIFEDAPTCLDEFPDHGAATLLYTETQVSRLEKQLAIATSALEFYAKPSSWGIDMPGMETSIEPCDQEDVEFTTKLINNYKRIRGGKRAREALQQIAGVE